METMTAQGLKKKYNSKHAPDVLSRSGFIEKLPKEKKGERVKYKIVKELPRIIDYPVLFGKMYVCTIADLIKDACNELNDLKEELQEWFDRLPESSQNGSKGSVLQDAISTLKNIQLPDIPRWVEVETTVFPPDMSGRTDRAHRRDCAVDKLKVVMEWVQWYEDTNWEVDDEKRSDLDSLGNNIKQIISKAENVKFPGMYS